VTDGLPGAEIETDSGRSTVGMLDFMAQHFGLCSTCNACRLQLRAFY
jgi:hypothetical protein